MIHSLHILQHVPFEGPGRILDWAQERGVRTAVYRLDEGDFPFSPGQGEGICIMGGPMNVYEEDAYPWLVKEKAFLTELATRQIPMLGICLGAQLLSVAHGAEVYRNSVPEIGWMPIEQVSSSEGGGPVFVDGLNVLHWHGDTFDLPIGARHLCRTAHCANQGFVVGRSLGLQFHLEAGLPECEQMVIHCAGELENLTSTIHSAEKIVADARIYAERASEELTRLLDAHFLPSVAY